MTFNEPRPSINANDVQSSTSLGHNASVDNKVISYANLKCLAASANQQRKTLSTTWTLYEYVRVGVCYNVISLNLSRTA